MQSTRAVVVGAGMAGLMAAAAIADAFTEVVVVEKDALPSEPALRKGVPQGGHVHTFLGYAVEAMDALLPGVMDELYAAGAVKIRRNLDIWFHDNAGPTPIRDVGILTPSVTRPLLEHITCKRVRDLPNVELRDNTRVLDFILDDAGRVSGVQIQSGHLVEHLSADLVVECSGRGSRFPRWLERAGFGTVPKQSMKIAMAYTSAFFKPPAALADDVFACLMLAIPPAKRAAYLTPVDDGLWLATMYGRGGEMAPRDVAGFLDWTRGLAHPVIYDKLVQAELVSEFRTYKIPYGNWFRFDQMPLFPEGIIPMGEALTSFNPMYGQGISLSAGQALAARDALTRAAGDSFAVNYFSGCEALNSLGWSVMETLDFAHASTAGERPKDLEMRWRMRAAVRQLSEGDDALHTLSVRLTHLLEKPSVLAQPDIVVRVEQLLSYQPTR